MEELLKKLGYSEEQIKTILDGMKEAKIYTTKEENADIRLSKLQEDFNGKDTELTKANELIKTLQEASSKEDVEKMKTSISEYETSVAQLKEELQQEKIKNQLVLALKEAKATDEDYIVYKINQQLKADNKKLELGEDGKIKGLNEIIEAQKKSEPNFFTKESKKEVDVKELGKGDEQTDNEPKNLKEALMQQYNEKTGQDL